MIVEFTARAGGAGVTVDPSLGPWSPAPAPALEVCGGHGAPAIVSWPPPTQPTHGLEGSHGPAKGMEQWDWLGTWRWGQWREVGAASRVSRSRVERGHLCCPGAEAASFWHLTEFLIPLN